jgi:hypothetical protein
MDFITYVQQKMTAYLPEVMAGYNGEVTAGSLGEMEVAVKAMTHSLGNEILREWVEAQEEKYPAERRGCPCGKKAKYVRRRKGMVITLQGRVNYRRAYYLGERCGKEHYPLDERLGIEPGQMSREVVKVAALCGIQDAFEAGSDLLARMTLLELSPNSVRKASQVIGEQVMNHEAQAQTWSQDLAAHLAQRRATNKPGRLYGSMESGRKQIGLERLKIAGVRWSEAGARKVAKARAAYLSGQWDEVTAPAPVLAKVA